MPNEDLEQKVQMLEEQVFKLTQQVAKIMQVVEDSKVQSANNQKIKWLRGDPSSSEKSREGLVR